MFVYRFEQDPRKWSGFEEHKEYNETIQNNQAKHCVVRSKVWKFLYKSVTWHEIRFCPKGVQISVLSQVHEIWSGFKQHEEYNETIHNNQAKHRVVRSKVWKIRRQVR